MTRRGALLCCLSLIAPRLRHAGAPLVLLDDPSGLEGLTVRYHEFEIQFSAQDIWREMLSGPVDLRVVGQDEGER